MSDDLISISEAARRLELSTSTLSRQAKLGKIRTYGDPPKVRLSEVIADRKANVAFPPGKAVKLTQVETKPDNPSHDDDDAPIGPRPFDIGAFGDVPLTRGLARELGRLVGAENPDDLSEVGYDLMCAGADILCQEILRLKAKAGEQ
jgi:hypothetical protein